MALIRCRECGGGVSSLAVACPHCGCPNRWSDEELLRAVMDIHQAAYRISAEVAEVRQAAVSTASSAGATEAWVRSAIALAGFGPTSSKLSEYCEFLRATVLVPIARVCDAAVDIGPPAAGDENWGVDVPDPDAVVADLGAVATAYATASSEMDDILEALGNAQRRLVLLYCPRAKAQEIEDAVAMRSVDDLEAQLGRRAAGKLIEAWEASEGLSVLDALENDALSFGGAVESFPEAVGSYQQQLAAYLRECTQAGIEPKLL